MSSRVIYKFNSMREPGTISFNGKAISLRSLISKIVEDRRLSRQQADFDLEVSNMQTKELYRGDETMIPKNTRLTIKRLPATFGVLSRMRGGTGSSASNPAASNGATAPDLDIDTFGGDLFSTDDADDNTGDVLSKLCDVAQQRSQLARQKNRQALKQSQAGLPGANRGNNFSLNRMGPAMTQGNAQKLQEQARRVNIGIPKTFLETKPPAAEEEGGEDAANNDGSAPATSAPAPAAGGWLKYQPSTSKFNQGVKERGGVTTKLSDEEVRKRIDDKDIPKRLICALTQKLLKDCVVLPCCNKPVSFEPIEQALINSNFVCPLCGSSGISTDRLKPDVPLRNEVSAFIFEQRDNIERKAAEEAEKAAAAADKEREQRLLEKKSYNRPDAVINLSVAASQQPSPVNAGSGSGDTADAQSPTSESKPAETSPTNTSVGTAPVLPPPGSTWSHAAAVQPGSSVTPTYASQTDYKDFRDFRERGSAEGEPRRDHEAAPARTYNDSHSGYGRDPGARGDMDRNYGRDRDYGSRDADRGSRDRSGDNGRMNARGRHGFGENRYGDQGNGGGYGRDRDRAWEADRNYGRDRDYGRGQGRDERDRGQDRGRGRGQDRGRDPGRGRDRMDTRDRDWDRRDMYRGDREHDETHDRDREFGYGRGGGRGGRGGRDRDFGRDRDRDRDHDRDRDRDRDRDHDRDHGRDHGRDRNQREIRDDDRDIARDADRRQDDARGEKGSRSRNGRGRKNQRGKRRDEDAAEAGRKRARSQDNGEQDLGGPQSPRAQRQRSNSNEAPGKSSSTSELHSQTGRVMKLGGSPPPQEDDNSRSGSTTQGGNGGRRRRRGGGGRRRR